MLTLLTVLLAWPAPTPAFAVVVLPAYFSLLTWFFWRTSRASPALQGQPMRLVCSGFFVLWLGFTLAAVIHFSGFEQENYAFVYLRDACEGGALFLLGTTLISYGLMLWIPQVLRNNQLLAAHSARQQSELQQAETTRTDLEQQLVEADRLGMLGELAASIAHDLRNPLTVVKGAAESLCRRARTPEDVIAHTDVIRRNIDKADQTIESMIDLARPKTHAATDTVITTALAEIEGLLHLEARRRKLRLAVVRSNAASAGAIVRGDYTLLAQALMNLSLNALQASPQHAEVLLGARVWGNHVAVIIEDRGAGLPEEVRANLFKPFFTTKPSGTGLGLPSCRRIARELGGDLRLYPRHRGGARALLWLPLANSLPAVSEPADGVEPCPATTC